MRISDWSSDVCSSDLVRPDSSAVAPILYSKADIDRQFEKVRVREHTPDEADKAVFLNSEQGTDYGTVTPSMVAVFTTLAAGGHQREHRHNAAATPLVTAGDGVHMDGDGTRRDRKEGVEGKRRKKSVEIRGR